MLTLPAAAADHHPVRVVFLAGGTHHWSSDYSDMGNGLNGCLEIAVGATPTVDMGLHLGLDALELDYPRGETQFDAALNDTYHRTTTVLFATWSPGRDVAEPYVGISAGVHGVRYGYATAYEHYDGTKEFGFGFGALAGLRYEITERVDAQAQVSADHSSSISSGWFVRWQAGFSRAIGKGRS